MKGWVRGVLRVVVLGVDPLHPRSDDLPVEIRGCVFRLQGCGFRGEIEMLSRMDPSTEHQAAGLPVIRPVPVIGVTLSVVDAGEDAAHFSL